MKNTTFSTKYILIYLKKKSYKNYTIDFVQNP